MVVLYAFACMCACVAKNNEFLFKLLIIFRWLSCLLMLYYILAKDYLVLATNARINEEICSCAATSFSQLCIALLSRCSCHQNYSFPFYVFVL